MAVNEKAACALARFALWGWGLGFLSLLWSSPLLHGQQWLLSLGWGREVTPAPRQEEAEAFFCPLSHFPRIPAAACAGKGTGTGCWCRWGWPFIESQMGVLCPLHTSIIHAPGRARRVARGSCLGLSVALGCKVTNSDSLVLPSARRQRAAAVRSQCIALHKPRAGNRKSNQDFQIRILINNTKWSSSSHRRSTPNPVESPGSGSIRLKTRGWCWIPTE